MAQENAKKFLEKVWADETLRDRIGGKAPEEIVEIAAEQGFDVTAFAPSWYGNRIPALRPL